QRSDGNARTCRLAVELFEGRPWGGSIRTDRFAAVHRIVFAKPPCGNSQPERKYSRQRKGSDRPGGSDSDENCSDELTVKRDQVRSGRGTAGHYGVCVVETGSLPD